MMPCLIIFYLIKEFNDAMFDVDVRVGEGVDVRVGEVRIGVGGSVGKRSGEHLLHRDLLIKQH